MSIFEEAFENISKLQEWLQKAEAAMEKAIETGDVTGLKKSSTTCATWDSVEMTEWTSSNERIAGVPTQGDRHGWGPGSDRPPPPV